jgi:Glycoside hydrolase family 44
MKPVHFLSLLLALALPAFGANPPITITVDANADRHAIDPRIYGSSWATAAQIQNMGLSLNRWGGNAMSRYNWIYSTANRCKDYYFFNIPDNVSSGDGSNGKSADDFIGLTRNAGAEPVMTIPMLALLPKDRSKRCSFPKSTHPNQDEFSNPAWEPIDCGNGKINGTRILGVPDPNNISTAYPLSHQGDWVQHMIDTWGTGANGIRHYSLDNEWSLWSADHWDVHPQGASYDEVWEKMSELGAIIRAKDPNAILTAPEEWGWSGYFMSGLDQENYGTPQQGADRAAHANIAYIDWILQQAAAYEQANGERILDVLTVHFYPQSGEFWSGDVSPAMQNLRNRSTRALWDPNYVDESWIGGTEVGGARVRLIPRLKEWVANHYPGTQIGITEYNWGAFNVENHINGATTQADILGIFGREGLDVGIRWGTPDVGTMTANAFRMYRNYDGAQSRFGNTSVRATVPNPDEVSAFASERSSDNALTIMIIAKRLTDETPVTVSLANFPAASAIQRWQLTSSNTITQLANLAPSSNAISLTVPAQSITLLVVPRAALPNPPALTATPSSTSQVALAWTAVPNAINYEVQRSFNNGGFGTLITVAGTSHNDGGLSANTAYVYKVRANVGGQFTAFSNADAATTTAFTDASIAPGTVIRRAHFDELRMAVNAMRASAGLPPQNFTDVLSAGTPVKTIHLTELRSALDAARAALGLGALGYTGGATIRAVQVNEVRGGVR